MAMTVRYHPRPYGGEGEGFLGLVFLRDRTGAAALVSLAPAGGEGLGEGNGGE
jgi:hypothetical protein